MKKNIIYNILFLLVFVVMACSEDFLKTEPTNKISNELALTNYTNIQKATNGIYAPLRASGHYGAYILIAPEVMADNVKRSSVKSSSRYVQEFDLTIAPSVGYWTELWDSPYFVINATNNIINKITEGDFDKEEANEKQINQLKGEALFVRALCYFDLCRLFAHHYGIEDASVAPGADGNGGHWGVPIILKSDISNYPQRSTVKDVYKQIISDLRSAENLLVFDRGKNFASKNAARALLARVYYYREDLDSASIYAQKVINTGEYSLADGKAEIVNYWIEEEADETIFQVYSNSTESHYAGAAGLVGLYNLDDAYYSDLVITQSLFNLYDTAVDHRGKLFIIDKNNEIRTKKFLKKTGATNVYESNIKVLRVAEMYLIAIEANIDNNYSEALEMYNDFIETRGLPSVNTLSKTQLLQERRKELAFEGHRLFDLAKAKANNVRSENNAKPLVTYPSHLYVLPIPNYEIERNNNISKQQNPGY